MGPEKENRDVQKTIRFKQSEYEQIKKDMAAYDYVSFVKYVRDTVLRKTKYKTRGKIKDREILYQIDAFTKQVQKLGYQYNQIVKSYNVLHQARALTIDKVDEHIGQLEIITEKVFSNQQIIINMINELSVLQQTEE